MLNLFPRKVRALHHPWNPHVIWAIHHHNPVKSILQSNLVEQCRLDRHEGGSLLGLLIDHAQMMLQHMRMHDLVQLLQPAAMLWRGPKHLLGNHPSVHAPFHECLSPKQLCYLLPHLCIGSHHVLCRNITAVDSPAPFAKHVRHGRLPRANTTRNSNEFHTGESTEVVPMVASSRPQSCHHCCVLWKTTYLCGSVPAGMHRSSSG